MTRFGDVRTDKGCLRNDANVLAISGIEADYDGGRVPLDHAIERLEKQGVVACVYTSPSHTDDAPRWRVLCPVSEELPSARRTHLLGRLTGLLGGILAAESWTLSQSYYFGCLNHNPAHRVELIDGQPIDRHDDLDTIWIGKSAAGTPDASADDTGRDLREDAELVRGVVTGDGLHTEMTALAARYVGRGMSPESTAPVLPHALPSRRRT